MRLVRTVVLASLLLSLVAAMMAPAWGQDASPRKQVREYPIRVKVHALSEDRQESRVYVVAAWGSCRNPTEFELNEFMRNIVPQVLRKTGRLPDPGKVRTGVHEGVVDLRERLGKDIWVEEQGKLPVWLMVTAERASSGNLDEDEHERYSGSLTDSWSLSSQFITRFCAMVPITKMHEEVSYTYIKPTEYTGQRAVFKWIDP